MGQVQSEMASSAAAVDQHQRRQEETQSSSPSAASNPPNSFESLIAEAAAFGYDENESIDARAQKALECPCIADLRTGPCGVQFSDAFSCFFKSTAEEQGSDCVHPFVALQNCIKANPTAFSEDILDGEEEAVREEKPAQAGKIIPPVWSREPKSATSKL